MAWSVIMVCIVAKQVLSGAHIAARAPCQTYILYLRLPDRNCVLFVDTLPQMSCLVILRQPRQKKDTGQTKGGTITERADEGQKTRASSSIL